MEVDITFKEMASSEPMRAHAEQQLQKIVRFLEHEREPIKVKLVLIPSKVHAHHRVELFVASPNFDLASTYEGPEFYAVLNRVVDVMYRKLLEQKREKVDDRKGPGKGQDFIDNE